MSDPKLCTSSSQELLAIYCAETGHTVEQILSKELGSRRPRVVAARRHVVRQLRDLWGFSWPEIGTLIQRDHVSAMNLYSPRRKRPKVTRLRVVA